MDMDALALILFHNRFLDHGVEGSEESLMADEEVCFAAQMMEHTSHFNSNIARTYKSNAFREFLEVKEAIRGYAEITARKIRDVWVAACGEKDLLDTDCFFGAVVKVYLDFVFRKEVGATVEIFYFVISQVLFINAVQTSNVGITLVLKRCKVEWRCLCNLESVRSSFVKCLSNCCGIPGDFLGNTSVLY